MPTLALGDPDAIEQLIDRDYDRLSPELQRAARWVRQHGTTLALHSMRSSARQAGVTPATMTRLAQRLGFDGFEALRAPFVRRLAEGGRSRPAARSRRRAHSLPDLLADLNQMQQANVADVLGLNGADALAAAADAMLRAPRVFFLGMRVSHGAAFQLHYAYSLLAGNGYLLNHLGGTLSDQLLQVGDGALLVAISQSPYARLTVDAVATARRQGARVIALTDSRLAPIARDAEHVLLFGGASNSFIHSTGGALALAETLLAVVARRGGDAVRSYLEMRQRRLDAERAYWDTPGREIQTPSDAPGRQLQAAMP
jgi:DNA-binding MurR/RpiR family transcriptional regulator